MTVSSRDLEEQLRRVREVESRLTFRISVLSKRLDQQAQGLLEGAGISLTAYRVLNIVNTFEEISISDISRFTAMDRAQISRTAMSLEAQGYVAFAQDAHSRRKKNVRLTDAGQDLLAALLPRFLERQDKIRETLGSESFEALSKGLDKLADMLAE